MAKVKKNYLIDMDGVLVHGTNMIPGADDFINRLIEEKRKFLILTNNPLYTTRDMAHRLQVTGLNIPEDRLFTSAIATASFLNNQRPNGTAYVIGELGLSEAIHSVGYTQTTSNPDYVVLGETFAYSIEQITIAVRLITAGARFIATNPDRTCPVEGGELPDCAGIIAALEAVTLRKVEVVVGKPSPITLQAALEVMGLEARECILVGDRLETDIRMALEAGVPVLPVAMIKKS